MIASISPSSLSFILVSLRDNVRVEVPRDLSYPSLLIMREAGEPTESKFVCLILESMQGFFFHLQKKTQQAAAAVSTLELGSLQDWDDLRRQNVFYMISHTCAENICGR